MSYIDLQPVLMDWDYDPDRISTRKILGADGTVKIQLRVELGLLQMESKGRPDGARPHGRETLLGHHKERLARFEKKNGTTVGFALSARECKELHEEASLYYRRYVSLFVLEEFEDVIADTAHNIAVMDMLREYAAEAEDRRRLEPFRPYVLMMDARARAYHALGEEQHTSALAHVNRGLAHIRSVFESWNKADAYEAAEETRILRELRQEIMAEMPQDSVIVLRSALREAVAEERYEEAAKLRAKLAECGDKADSEPGLAAS